MCEYERLRGKTCAAYQAPSLWCKACAPVLFIERGLNPRRWPEYAHLASALRTVPSHDA